MSYPKDFPNGTQIQVAVIGGGDITDPAPDQSSNQKLYSPLEHSEDVLLEHLAFSPMNHSPTQHSQQAFQGALDPGSLVYVLKTTGQNGGIILGQANDLLKMQGGQGGKDIMSSNQIIKELLDRKIKIYIPPNIKEDTERGAKVRKIEEKGEEHRHNVLKGLPSNGALFPMSGWRLPQLKEVPTAKQHWDNLLSSNGLGQLGGLGDLMSLGKMFQGLLGGLGGGGGGGGAGGGASAGAGGTTGQTPSSSGQSSSSSGQTSSETSNTVIVASVSEVPKGTKMDQVLSNLEPDLQDALVSLSLLIQGSENDTVGSYATANRVHTETYLNNAADLLGQVTNLSDIMDVLQRLQWDESLFGLENIEPITFTEESAFGNANKKLYANGMMEVSYSNTSNSNTSTSSTQSPNNNQNSNDQGLGDMAGNADQMPGVNPGDGLFTDSAKTMFDMFKRMAPKSEKEATRLTKKLNKEDTAKKLWKIVEKTVKGGNPLDPELYKDAGNDDNQSGATA